MTFDHSNLIREIRDNHMSNPGNNQVFDLEAIQEEYRARMACPCDSGLLKEPEHDAQGIFLCYACDRCRAKKLSHYRPEILSGYDQNDVNEPIESDNDDETY